MRGIGALIAAGAAALTVTLGMVSLSTLSLTTMTTGLRGDQPSRRARRDIPHTMLVLYRQAAATCPGLSWSVLAAIGKVETDHGRARDQVSSAGAVGVMQFLPATFRTYSHPIPAGGARPATPWDPTDAVYAAARLLCHNGAGNQHHQHHNRGHNRRQTGNRRLRQAIYAYNHASSYVHTVLRIAAGYRTSAAASAAPAGPPGPGSGAGRAAASWALRQRGKPYVWGADGPGSYDCSGLTMRAWQHAGITIPRTTYAQYRIGQPVPRGRLQPGDLVFFHPGPRGPEHVGLYLGHGRMVEAPHTGDVVKTAPISRSDYLGARRPTR